ncbi:MAG: hypothetical protein Ct9H300mP9_7810 [Candidatus Neomarinimicrobiota bacterium]|nr:MAG: hypothetical protein Ct9H300mP9_7810 [Candidatus Neomarinimicrobiota bacterium]
MVLTVILSIGVIGCSESRAEVNLPTLMCGMCEQNFKNSLNDLDGIKFVNIDLEKKIGKITFDKEKVDCKISRKRLQWPVIRPMIPRLILKFMKHYQNVAK